MADKKRLPDYTASMMPAHCELSPRRFFFQSALVLFIVNLSSVASAQAPAAHAFPEAERLFRQNPDWLGSDGANSTPLGNGRIFWSFEDTIIATTDTHSRQDSTMVRNSVAIQTGDDPLTAKMSFYWGRDADGSPASFFPEEGDEWYWTGGSLRLDEGPLITFLHRTRPTPGVGLGFANAGYALALIKNPDQPPTAWKPVIIKARQSEFDAVPATAIVRDGEYVVGLALKQQGVHAAALVRYLASALAEGNIDHPQWWSGPESGWVEEQQLGPSGPALIMDDAGAECSVHWDHRTQSFLHIATYGFGAATIGVRSAPSLTGPWSDPLEVYRPPESDNPRPFVYAAIAHPELRGSDPADLLVTYATNSFEFGDLFTQYGSQHLYWPRVIKLKIDQ